CSSLPPTSPALAVALVTFFSSNGPATTNNYTLSLHDALPILTRNTPSSSESKLIKYFALHSDKSISVAPVSPVSSSTVKTHSNRSEEHTSELQSRFDLVCRLLLEKKNDLPSH